MIPYFGTPISGSQTVAIQALKGAHGFVSFAHPGQLNVVVEVCQSFAVDNGAFSFWKSGKKTDWESYYKWVDDVRKYPNFDWAVIPDVIEGKESDNNMLMELWPFPGIGVPVFHLHESNERLTWICKNYKRIAIGGSCQYKQVGGKEWWERINEVMDLLCDKDGRPTVKIHGLRMLDHDIVCNLPLSSADSCSLGINVGLDASWNGRNQPLTKEARAMILRHRIEHYNSPIRWQRVEVLGQ